MSPRQIANKAYTLACKKLDRDDRRRRPQYHIRERVLLYNTMNKAEDVLNKRTPRTNRRVMAAEDEDDVLAFENKNQQQEQQAQQQPHHHHHEVSPLCKSAAEEEEQEEVSVSEAATPASSSDALVVSSPPIVASSYKQQVSSSDQTNIPTLKVDSSIISLDCRLIVGHGLHGPSLTATTTAII